MPANCPAPVIGTLAARPSPGEFGPGIYHAFDVDITFVSNGFTWSTPFGLIGYTSYAPSSRTPYTASTTGFAVLDATNLTVTFVAPSSGKVLVQLSGTVVSTTEDAWWGLINSSGGAVIGPTAFVAYTAAGSTTVGLELTGLTAGTSYTLEWAACASTAINSVLVAMNAGGSTVALPNSTTGAPATMMVFAG